MSLDIVKVESIMTKDVKTAKENQTVKAAAKSMSENGIGSLVIVKSQETVKPVGIITERDIIRILGSRPATALGKSLRDIMSKPIITIEPQSSLRDAIQTMHSKNIRRLPVAKGEQMLGIITDKDIFRAIMRSQDLASSLSGDIIVAEYRPMYERLSEFMLGEMLIPGKNQ